jgi:stress-induced morphogen
MANKHNHVVAANMSQPQVQDISGGCGSMYAIEIESPRFQGLTVIKQHKLVNQVLKEEIAQWHGVQLRTKAA